MSDMGETTPLPFTPGRWEIDRLGVCVRLPIGTRGQQIRRIARTVATTGYRDAALDAENTRNAHLIAGGTGALRGLKGGSQWAARIVG